MAASQNGHVEVVNRLLGHSMSNQRKIRLTPFAIVWFYGENNPHQILMSYVIWLPSYNDSNFVSFC